MTKRNPNETLRFQPEPEPVPDDETKRGMAP